MKIPRSIRSLYDEHVENYRSLEVIVNRQMESIRDSKWHYEGRIKTDVSFAQKLETGRFTPSECLGDMFACTLVVERIDRIADAERIVSDKFNVLERKPSNPAETLHRASCFDYDFVRLGATLRGNESTRPTGYETLVFEIQIKTFLQHAWSIATHDLIYKGNMLDWESERTAFQVKAMLEHAEASIGAVAAITNANKTPRVDKTTSEKQEIVSWLEQEWSKGGLPADTIRLATCVHDLMKMLHIDLNKLKSWFSAANAKGKGSNTLNLSPYGAIVAAVLDHAEGLDALKSMAKRKYPPSRKVLTPAEIEFPLQDDSIEACLCRVN